MAQYVAKLHDDTLTDLLDYVRDLKGVSNISGNAEVEVRGNDPAEAEAVAEAIAALRDALGLTGRITYHLCRHDEGVGHCTGVVEK